MGYQDLYWRDVPLSLLAGHRTVCRSHFSGFITAAEWINDSTLSRQKLIKCRPTLCLAEARFIFFFVIGKDCEIGKALTEPKNIKLTKHRQYYQYSREQAESLKLCSQIGNFVRKNKLKSKRGKCTLGKKTQTHELYIGEQFIRMDSSEKDKKRVYSTIKSENESAPTLLQKDIMSYCIDRGTIWKRCVFKAERMLDLR